MKTSWLLILLILSFFLFAQSRDKKLERKVLPLLQGFNGQVGLYIKNLNN